MHIVKRRVEAWSKALKCLIIRRVKRKAQCVSKDTLKQRLELSACTASHCHFVVRSRKARLFVWSV